MSSPLFDDDPKLYDGSLQSGSGSESEDEPVQKKPRGKNRRECHNRLLKQAHTLRRLLPFADFLKVAVGIVNSWSVSPEVYRLPMLRQRAEDLVSAFDKHAGEYENFKDFADSRFSVYVVENVGAYTKCNCRYGAKKHACTHSVMIACLPSVAIETYPPDAVAERPCKSARLAVLPKKLVALVWPNVRTAMLLPTSIVPLRFTLFINRNSLYVVQCFPLYR